MIIEFVFVFGVDGVSFYELYAKCKSIFLASCCIWFVDVVPGASPRHSPNCRNCWGFTPLLDLALLYFCFDSIKTTGPLREGVRYHQHYCAEGVVIDTLQTHSQPLLIIHSEIKSTASTGCSNFPPSSFYISDTISFG